MYVIHIFNKSTFIINIYVLEISSVTVVLNEANNKVEIGFSNQHWNFPLISFAFVKIRDYRQFSQFEILLMMNDVFYLFSM